ncbi:unnamed protein product [Ceratitis capitata]|uniref:(Mediterranean fruit fly) hypothetical protein n=1 Tax=Ceratitis capitata TaxID=7213 RepID=A0A811V4G5_CERCA|nr:unnamed protein product [Ceratitis capitata]
MQPHNSCTGDNLFSSSNIAGIAPLLERSSNGEGVAEQSLQSAADALTSVLCALCALGDLQRLGATSALRNG